MEFRSLQVRMSVSNIRVAKYDHVFVITEFQIRIELWIEVMLRRQVVGA